MSAASWQSWSQSRKLESESHAGRFGQIWRYRKFFFFVQKTCGLQEATITERQLFPWLCRINSVCNMPSFEALLGDPNTPVPQETLESATMRGLSGINAAGVDGEWHLLSPTRDPPQQDKSVSLCWVCSVCAGGAVMSPALATEVRRDQPHLLLASRTTLTWRFCTRKSNCRSVSQWLFVVMAAANPCFHSWLFWELKVWSGQGGAL